MDTLTAYMPAMTDAVYRQWCDKHLDLYNRNLIEMNELAELLTLAKIRHEEFYRI